MTEDEHDMTPALGEGASPDFGTKTGQAGPEKGKPGPAGGNEPDLSKGE